MLKLVLLVAFGLLAPSAAHGDAPRAWQRKALAEAQRVWRPACGTLRIAFEPAPPASEGILGGWAAPGSCTLAISADYEWLGYPEFCHVILHEAGHAAGRDHSDHGIMRPLLSVSYGHGVTIDGHGRRHRSEEWEGVDRRCLN